MSLFKEGLEKQWITGVRRKAKYLLIHLSSGKTLAAHLRMSGQLILKSSEASAERFTRIIFVFDNEERLHLISSIGYSRLYLLEREELNSILHLDKLGPEPLADDCTFDLFSKLLARRTGKIKPLLLNQRFISGIGNIYADECLFAAGIHPERKAKNLSADDIKRLYEAIRTVLQAGIADRGTTIDTYCDVSGRKGTHQDNLAVFRRTGKPCFNCGTPITKTRVGGRETFFCPQCQK